MIIPGPYSMEKVQWSVTTTVTTISYSYRAPTPSDITGYMSFKYQLNILGQLMSAKESEAERSVSRSTLVIVCPKDTVK